MMSQAFLNDLLQYFYISRKSRNHLVFYLVLLFVFQLENLLAQQQHEVKTTKDKLASHDAAAKRAVSVLQNELKLRVDQVSY